MKNAFSANAYALITFDISLADNIAGIYVNTDTKNRIHQTAGINVKTREKKIMMIILPNV